MHHGEDGLVPKPCMVVVQHNRHSGLKPTLRKKRHYEQHENQIAHVEHAR